MSLLRDRMARDMERANLSERTRKQYIHAVEILARFHHKSPDLLVPDDIRAWEDDLVGRGLGPNIRRVYLAGAAFLYRKTLSRPEMVSFIVPARDPRRLPRVLDVTMVQWTAFLVFFVAVGVPALDREWRHILEPYEIARTLEGQGAMVYQGRLTETQLGYASLELQHVLAPVPTPEAVAAALAAPVPVVLLLEPTLYWKRVIQPRGFHCVEVPLEAARFKEIWFRTPVLLLNDRAWELHRHSG